LYDRLVERQDVVVKRIMSPLKLVISGCLSKHGKGRSKDPDLHGQKKFGRETDVTEANGLQSGWLSASAHHHCRKLSVHLCFQFPHIEEYLVDRITIGCMG
jgi:hypothetical protein